MTDPDRIPCCIRGCRRTFKREAAPDGGEVMCRKHYRCDPELVRLRKAASRVVRLLRTRYRRVYDLNIAGYKRSGSPQLLAKVSRVYWLAVHRDSRLWGKIKAEAQRRQDAGFFAPKPRSRRKNVETVPTDPLSSRFEDQFQRLKRAQAEATRSC